MAERVYDLILDEGNRSEMARHGVDENDLEELLANWPVVLPNRGGHKATHVVIGRAFSGRFLTVPVEPIDREAGLWRPATAWDSKDSEVFAYYRAGGR